MVNKLYADREFYITELTAIKDRLGDTTVLEKERRILDEQLGIDGIQRAVRRAGEPL